ncbi:hypothetical protein HPP92_006512 [Vanilla planifolia]|uniref:Uncharacterized protein n=2 Tax=Vanilla planifolia TaxID=51239 RepID=A0A835RKG5_VANPL|nr:hypothetical protein HPP92_006512 [Vanilla planifolia]
MFIELDELPELAGRKAMLPKSGRYGTRGKRETEEMAKRAGSKLKSRIVANQAICCMGCFIEQNEDQILQFAGRKAENMITHKEDIYSRPQKDLKKLPRKKRRRLEAAREMLENGDVSDLEQRNGSGDKTKAGQSVVEAAYRRAKAVKIWEELEIYRQED